MNRYAGLGIYKLIVLAVTVVILLGIFYYIGYGRREVRIATTTSLYNTGLLDFIVDSFRERYPEIDVKILPLGSGAALETGSRGDADLVLVHAPKLEKSYIDMGILTAHRIIAYNYFILVGPKDDPANVSNQESIIDAFKVIYTAGSMGKAYFISRGDRSGTHIKELSIWSKIGIKPSGEWYIESGSGMAQTLIIANEKGGYTLSDIGTYIALKENGRIDNLVILYSGDDELINIYSIYLVNPEKVAGVNYGDAYILYKFIIDNIRYFIEEYNSKYSVKLFYPADNEDILMDKWWMLAG